MEKQSFQKYCSKKCCHKYCAEKNYAEKKEDYLRRAREWRDKKIKENPVKFKSEAYKRFSGWKKRNKKHFNALMMKDYRRHKNKWNSRKITGRLLRFHPELLKKFCKKCKTKINLEIHHEIYPTRIMKIIEAIKKEKIYYLCRKHHNLKK